MTEAEQNRLIQAHLDYVRHIAQEYRAIENGPDFEDLVAAGTEGLVLAGRAYDGSVKFWSYARHRVRGQIQDFIDGWTKLEQVGGPEEFDDGRFCEWTAWGGGVPYEKWTRLAATPEELTVAFDALNKKRTWLRQAIKFLPLRERQIMLARFFRDPPQTLESIALDHGISYAKTVRIIKKTVLLLKEQLSNRAAQAA